MHKDHEVLARELEAARKQVRIGGTYSHYKNPDRLYKVIGLGVQEVDDGICVIYQAQYGKELIFVRDLDDWVKEPSPGMPRFKLLDR
ncbi:MAG: DUF1653 domain-containing protein [Candidatus Micrarchaeota archaeon]|nr:DUF1653 domain-containing protein [Candidatus Micrarchaeota archaeon]